jgi:hypothetical protein
MSDNAAEHGKASLYNNQTGRWAMLSEIFLLGYRMLIL